MEARITCWFWITHPSGCGYGLVGVANSLVIVKSVSSIHTEDHTCCVHCTPVFTPCHTSSLATGYTHLPVEIPIPIYSVESEARGEGLPSAYSPSFEPFTHPLFSKLVLRTFLSRSLIHLTRELVQELAMRSLDKGERSPASETNGEYSNRCAPSVTFHLHFY